MYDTRTTGNTRERATTSLLRYDEEENERANARERVIPAGNSGKQCKRASGISRRRRNANRDTRACIKPN